MSTGRQWLARQRLAREIRADLAGAVEGIIRAGQHLREAHAVVGSPGWAGFLKECGLSGPMASKLIAIAAHPVLGDFSHCENLPPSVETIYVLSLADPGALATMMRDVTTIRPSMTRADAYDIVHAYPRKKARRGKRPGRDETGGGLVSEVLRFIGLSDYEHDRLSEIAANGQALKPHELSAIRTALEMAAAEAEAWLAKLPERIEDDDEDLDAEGTAASG